MIPPPKQFIHLDMDAFYASVEVLDNPSLKGKPVIVGGSEERGVVSSASYEARTYGVHSAQPIAAARRLCPRGVFLRVRMDRYKEVSQRIFDIFHRYTPLVEPLSLDEAFLDVSGSTKLFGTAEDIARRIKSEIKEETGLTASAGVAPLKFVAKIASDFKKPDGLTVVPLGKIKEFLSPLPIEKLWGIGKVTERTLSQLGVRTIGDLGNLPTGLLEAKLGKHGRQLHLLGLGVDERAVEPEREVKSIGHEITFPQDITSLEQAKAELLALSARVVRRLRRHELVSGTITLKVKYHNFQQTTRSITLPGPISDRRAVFQYCCNLLEKTAAGKRPVRLLGVSLSGLRPVNMPRERFLFTEDAVCSKNTSLNDALDEIQNRFGDNAIFPSTLLKKR